MKSFIITQEILDYIAKKKDNFSEIKPAPSLGEEWVVTDYRTYPNVNNSNPVIEAERKDGCFMRLPEDIVYHYIIDYENNSFSV